MYYNNGYVKYNYEENLINAAVKYVNKEISYLWNAGSSLVIVWLIRVL